MSTQLIQVSNLLVTINSSVNFVIYCIFGNKFKQTFLQLFCCCRRGRTQTRQTTMEMMATVRMEQQLRSTRDTTGCVELTSSGIA